MWLGESQHPQKSPEEETGLLLLIMTLQKPTSMANKIWEEKLTCRLSGWYVETQLRF